MTNEIQGPCGPGTALKQVCFRKRRPLILITENPKLQTKVDKIVSAISIEEKNIISQVGLQLLETALEDAFLTFSTNQQS